MRGRYYGDKLAINSCSIYVILYSDKIEKSTQENKKIKKFLIALCCALVLAIAYILLNIYNKVGFI